MTAPYLVCNPHRAALMLTGGDGRPVPLAVRVLSEAALAPGVDQFLTLSRAVRRINDALPQWGLTAGLSPARAVRRANRAIEWASHGWSAEQMSAWAEAGVNAVGQATQWLELGATPSDVRAVRSIEGWVFVREADLPVEFLWGALRRHCSPGFAKAGYEQGVDVATVLRFAKTLTGLSGSRGAVLVRGGVEVVLPWTEAQCEERDEYALGLAGLDWGDVRTCLRSGMEPFEAARYVRDGGDMDPVRLMAALTG